MTWALTGKKSPPVKFIIIFYIQIYILNPKSFDFFGRKSHFYPEYFVLKWFTKLLFSMVKYGVNYGRYVLKSNFVN